MNINVLNTSNITQTNETTPITPDVAINTADTTWILISTCLVFIMIPGVGYYYGGIIKRKNLLTLFMSTALSVAIVSIQWFIWGFSLSFSETGSAFNGNLDNAALTNIGNKPHSLAPTIPANVFMIFQCMFAAITPCLAFGSAAERTTMPAYILFLVIWSTIVFDFIAYWVWAPHGWLKAFGVLDFAGGTPVHVTSGFSALAYALAVGPRRTVNFKDNKPSNIADVFLGTTFLWFGWFGFNGGSELAINSRAVNAIVVTNIAASVGALSWMFTEMLVNKTKKMSLNGFCCGAVSGLVCITPASGFVSPAYAIIFGFLAGVGCYFACFLKKLSNYKYDDACDVFAVHGVGGMIGCLLTGIFAQNSVATMSGDAPIKGGWVDGNFMQICYQMLSIVVPASWAFVMTFLILQIIGFIPFIKLKLSEQEEEIGGDWIELGEVSYGHDIEYYERELLKKIRKEARRETGFHILKNSYFKNSKSADFLPTLNENGNAFQTENDPSQPKFF